MKIYQGLDMARGVFGPSAVAIGNFDGVHAGHRALLANTVRLARETNSRASVITFHPHPTMIVAPERAPKLLTNHEERAELIRQQGIEQLLILHFHRSLSQLTPEEFFHQVLREALGARAITVGDNFRFGQGQAGNAGTLKELGAGYGIEVEALAPVRRRGVVVSSSEIRNLLARGQVSKAARLLERPYSLSGSVVPGAGRGSRETVPTLNLETHSIDGEWKALPANGVYITRTTCLDTGRLWPSITNNGMRPTFDGRHLTVETFLLAPLEGPGPARIRIEYLRWVRGEKKFASAEDLRAQILRDAGRAQTYFRRLRSALAPAPQG